MSIATTQATPVAVWTGRILSGLVIAFLVLDAGMKLVPLQPVMEAMSDLGFPARLQPVKDKRAGDTTDFDSQYLFNTTLHPEN